MRKEEVLSLLEDDTLVSEQGITLSKIEKPINIGRTSGMIVVDPTIIKPTLKGIDVIKIK